MIAHALNYLKTKVLESLRIIKPRIRSSDIDWVITVPAIWNAHGKQMMREAGYQVILNNNDNYLYTMHMKVHDNITGKK